MERISIFNYEAFYLDFLEGNLNEADTLLLMNFLESNPDLKVDMDGEFNSFQEESVVLDDFSKLMLKSDVEEVLITSENVNYFIVAQTEGILDEEKSSELAFFIKGNSVLEKESKLAGLVLFQPDAEIVFADKASLKQKRRIVVLWPYAAAIAAASVVLFFWSTMDSTPTSVEPVGSKMSASTNSRGRNEKGTSASNLKKSNQNENEVSNKNNLTTQAVNEISKNAYEKKVVKESPIDQMKSNPIGPIASINEQKLAPIGTHHNPLESPTNDQHKEADVLALATTAGMHNPIEPLTKFVSKKTNTEIEFKTTPKVEDERRGFHIKIGKFEISRNKRP